MAEPTSIQKAMKASPLWQVLVVALVFSALFLAAVFRPVLAFKGAVALSVVFLAWRDQFNVYFLVLLIPFLTTALFLIDPKAGFPYDPYVFGVWIVFLAVRWGGGARVLRFDLVDILVLIYVAIGIVYYVFSHDKALAYQGFKYDHRPLLVYLLLRATGSVEGDWKKVAWFIVVLMFLVLGDAFYRYLFDYMSAFEFQVSRSANLPDMVRRIAGYYGIGMQTYARLASIWMYSTGLGPMLMVIALLLLGLRKFVIEKGGVLLFGILFCVVFLGLLLTYSRSGWIGLIVGTVLLVLLEEKREIRKMFARAVFIFVAVAAVALVASGFLSGELVRRVTQIWTDEFGEGGHFYFLALSVFVIVSNPLGTGLGTGFATETGSSAGIVWNESTYLRVGMEKGILPMLFFLVLLGLMTWRIYQRYKVSSGDRKVFYQTAFAVSVSILLINVTFPFWETLMTYYFVFLAAFAVNDKMGWGRPQVERKG